MSDRKMTKQRIGPNDDTRSLNDGIAIEKYRLTYTQTMELPNSHNSSVALNVDENRQLEDTSVGTSPSNGSNMDRDVWSPPITSTLIACQVQRMENAKVLLYCPRLLQLVYLNPTEYPLDFHRDKSEEAQ